MTAPLIPVSWGELLDKLTILAIKQRRIADPEARANVAAELRLLRAAAGAVLLDARVAAPLEALRAVNEALWDIEDAIRREEARGEFGPGFVALARAVYQRNDERAAIKREINAALGSELVEEKSYWRASPGAGIEPHQPRAIGA